MFATTSSQGPFPEINLADGRVSIISTQQFNIFRQAVTNRTTMAEVKRCSRLCVADVSFKDFEELVKLIQCFPVITCLELEYCSWSSLSALEYLLLSQNTYPAEQLQVPMSLSNVTVSIHVSANHETLAQWLMRSPDHNANDARSVFWTVEFEPQGEHSSYPDVYERISASLRILGSTLTGLTLIPNFSIERITSMDAGRVRGFNTASHKPLDLLYNNNLQSIHLDNIVPDNRSREFLRMALSVIGSRCLCTISVRFYIDSDHPSNLDVRWFREGLDIAELQRVALSTGADLKFQLCGSRSFINCDAYSQDNLRAAIGNVILGGLNVDRLRENSIQVTIDNRFLLR